MKEQIIITATYDDGTKATEIWFENNNAETSDILDNRMLWEYVYDVTDGTGFGANAVKFDAEDIITDGGKIIARTEATVIKQAVNMKI